MGSALVSEVSSCSASATLVASKCFISFILSPGGAIIATNTAVHVPDLTEFYTEITAILNQCDQTADRRGFQKCTGFTMHTPKGIIMMITAAPSTDEYLHFVALMSPEANGFFMRIQLEKLIPQILG